MNKDIPYKSTRSSFKLNLPSRYTKELRSKIYCTSLSEIQKRHKGLFEKGPVITLVERRIVGSSGRENDLI
jgi:hypothetical protein